MFDRIFKSEFGKNVITLMSGTLIGQAIPFIATFILTRIFTPEDFGVFAIYFSLVNILGTISTGRYEMAILLPKSDLVAFDLVKISLVLSLLFSSLCFIVILILQNFLKVFILNTELIKYLYYLPLSIFGFAAYKVYTVWYTRVRQYKKISLSIIVKSLSGVFFNIIIGYFFGLIGLFLGNIISSLFAVFIIRRNFFSDLSLKYDRSRKLLSLYYKFPLYDIPTSFVYTLSKHGIVLLINKGFSSVITGLYSMTERLLISPSQVFVGSYIQVYNQQITEKYNLNHNINSFVIKNIVKISKVLGIPYVICVYSSFYFIPFVLGDNWSELYKYIYILSPLIFFSMVLNPLGYILKILDKQNVSFIQHLVLTVVKLGCLFIFGFLLKFSILNVLMIYVISSLIVLMYNANIIFRLLFMSSTNKLMVFCIGCICILLTIFNYYLICQ
ncbi:lipopolysaccharide biosynthesis protein [Galbibacter sp. PAP.153]|uniref:lipopolysaccharide biosynthesis protein n=1 Tax=Galbibacter sp. PAP.153 TaxID=3104623 RepID=UPI00300842CF